MQWIAASERDADNAEFEQRLSRAAEQFRANSGLKSQGYSAPNFDFHRGSRRISHAIV